MLSVLSILLCTLCHGQFGGQPTETSNRVTIIYDAFTSKPELALDWGYAALVEFEGKRILFDIGNNPELFAANIKRLQVDLTRLDFVVISHRHGDHTSGLRYLRSVNPKVPIYAPNDESFLDVTPAAFLTQNADSALPSNMRYFDGKIPAIPLPHGQRSTSKPFKAQKILRHIFT